MPVCPGISLDLYLDQEIIGHVLTGVADILDHWNLGHVLIGVPSVVGVILDHWCLASEHVPSNVPCVVADILD